MAAGRSLTPARLAPRDVVRTGFLGLRSRPVRAVLSSLGIAIGIATLISVVGISSSSQADLNRRLDRLGTGLLTVQPGKTLFGEEAKLPKESIAMVARIGSVSMVGATGDVPAGVYRNDRIPADRTAGISVRAVTGDLLGTLRGRVRGGTWFNPAQRNYQTTVLGSLAARRLGVSAAGAQVWLGDRWFVVVGILDTMPLAPGVDRAALVGWPVAQRLLGFDGHPTTIYERSRDDTVDDVRSVLARTADPENPEQVTVSRPSDGLAAKAAAAGAFTDLLLGLGAIALLVGGVGVANTMVISVLERRGEIGLRRSLGATRGQIRLQFLTESLMLSGLGGLAGAAAGAVVTIAYATAQGLPPVIPPWALGGGLAATLFTGALAGIYPAVRAARLAPTVALTTT